jgi:glycosyltransferase involved in cell wall biosynthesis
VYAPGFTALLQPRSRLTAPAGIRYDSPPSLSRTGRRGAALLRRLEDRAFRSVRILLPWGVTPRPELVDALPPGPAVVSLPVPISGADGARDRDATAVTYASRNPRKKGLDLVLEAWRAGAPPGMTLLIAGISEADGRRWCRRNGVGVPPATRWVGTLAPEAWRALLASCSFYLSASRYEDHGLAQLEALALGALLVTVRSPGWFEPLTLADQLPGRLVAEAVSAPALADALGRAHRLDETARDAYRRCARGLTTAYSEATLDERLRTEVLPLLLPVQETVCR